jgi:hypothetical protein
LAQLLDSGDWLLLWQIIIIIIIIIIVVVVVVYKICSSPDSESIVVSVLAEYSKGVGFYADHRYGF